MTMPEVKAVYLGHGTVADAGDAPHTMIAVDAKANWQLLARRVMEVVPFVCREGQMVDLLDNRGVAPLFRGIKPFYRRKLFGLF